VDGLYNQEYAYPPETIVSHSFFMKNPEEFYRFMRDKMIYPDAKPNTTHLRLAELEARGKLKAVITQNIDRLHQKAGSKTVYELHGNCEDSYCMKCRKSFEPEYILNSTGVPRCDVCGGIIRPDVVLYEEALDQEVVTSAVDAIAKADVLIIGGTSLIVYPAASFIDYYRGHKLVLINKSATPKDGRADLLIHESLGTVFSQV